MTPSQSLWFYILDRRKLGPIPFAELAGLAAAGRLGPADMVLREGDRHWLPLGSVIPPARSNQPIAIALPARPSHIGPEAGSTAAPPLPTASPAALRRNLRQMVVASIVVMAGIGLALTFALPRRSGERDDIKSKQVPGGAASNPALPAMPVAADLREAASDSDSAVVVAEGAGGTADEALCDAYRNSVRLVVGAYVDEETRVKNDEVIDDEVLTYSNGIVKKYEELSTKKQAGLLRVRIRPWSSGGSSSSASPPQRSHDAT
jgi:hypothetical protein